MSWQKPILFSEMKLYHESMRLPYPLGVFVDSMRLLEQDDMKGPTKKNNKDEDLLDG